MRTLSVRQRPATRPHQRGSVLILSMWLVAGVTVLSLASLQIMRMETRRQELTAQNAQALYLAECGVEWIRGVAANKAAQVVAFASPRGSTMPTLTFAQLGAAAGLTRTSTYTFETTTPRPVTTPDGTVAGHFVLTLALVYDVVGSTEAPPPPSEVIPPGNGWLPTVEVTSTGVVGDPTDPEATRTLSVSLRPLPPAVVSGATLPPPSAFLDGSGKARSDLTPGAFQAYVPSYGEPVYEVARYLDSTTLNARGWDGEQIVQDPRVYPPVTMASTSGKPLPWWRIPGL